MEVRQVILEVAGRARGAQRELQDLQTKVQELRSGASFNIRADTARASRRIGELRAELKQVDRTRVSPEISVQVGKALVDLELMQARINALPKSTTIDVDIRRGILEELSGVERGVVSAVRSLDKASRPAQSFGAQLGDMAQTVKALVPVLNGLAIIIGVKLVAGLIALGASAASAVGGLLALGTAFAAALGPAVALFIALVSRITKVLAALKLQDQARNEAQRKSAAGSQAAATAAEQRRAAEEGVRNALQASTTAERGLAEARRTALDAIRTAQQQAADTARSLKDAITGLAQATVEGFRAMQDAAERVTQALFDVRRAKDGIEEARVAVRDIRNEIRKLGRSVGVTGGNLNSLITRATDVSFDPRRLRALIGSFLPADSDQSKALEMEKLILRLRDAKLTEDEANHRLTTSERELGRARQDNAKFQAQGVRAYGPLRDAIKNLEDARRNANDADAEARRLEKLGVEGAPSVIAALEGVRNAEQSLADARRRQKQAKDTGATNAAEAAKVATDKLTASEQKFLSVLQQVRTELTGFFGPAVDAVFGAMTRALSRAPALLLPLQSAFTQLGETWAGVIDAFSVELVKPEWVSAIRSFTTAAGQLSSIIGGDIFISFLRIFRDLAEATMPALVTLMQDFAASMRNVANFTADVSNIAPTINIMVESFRVWLGLAKAVGDAIIALIQVAGPIGDELVGWIADAVKGFADWVRSAEGQKQIKQFFEDTIPSVKALLAFLVKLARVFFQLIQFASPFLAGGLAVLNTVLDLFSKLLGFINDIVSNPWGRAIRFAIGEFLTLRTVVSIVNAIVTVISRLAVLLGSLPARAGSLASFLVRPFVSALGTLRTIMGAISSAIVGTFARLGVAIPLRVAHIITGIVTLFLALPGRLGAIASSAASAVAGALRAILSHARRLLQPLIDIGHTLVDGFLLPFRGMAAAISAIFEGVIAGIKGAVNVLIGVVNFVIKRINDIPNIKTPFGNIGIPDIATIKPLAAGGLVTGPTMAMLGEKAGLSEAVLPLTKNVMGRLAKALSLQLGSAPALAGAGAGGGDVHNHFHIPRPLDSTRDPDPENTAALLQQAWERRGGGLG